MLYLDSALSLTHGSPFRLSGMLTRLRPTSEHFTGVAPASNGTEPLIGQVYYHGGEKSAHLSYLLPLGKLSAAALPVLLEALAWQAGEWGAFHLQAEVDERSPVFEGLRAAGFSTYARQRLWRIDNSLAAAPAQASWRAATSTDETAVRNLHALVMPPLVQAAEPLNLHLSHGLVFYQNGELVGYADVNNGPKGVYLRPLIHPDVEGAPVMLAGLVAGLHPKPKRPVYLAVRSYEAWLEPPLEEIGASVSPRQALLVRHLANAVRVTQALPHLNVLDRRIETGAPMVRNLQSNSEAQPPSPYRIQEP